MLDNLIEQIQKAVKPEIIDLGGAKYTSRELFYFPDDPIAPALKVSTLQAVIDYLENGIDEAENIFIHIADFDTVRICSYLNSDRAREILLQASYAKNNFNFGSQYDQTEFITKLQSCFVDNDVRQRLQKLAGGLNDESGVKLTDDGMTQHTVVQAGITTFERQKIENPFALKPFRTFPEVEQPESAFVLRLHKNRDDVPTISLHEADNSAWKLEAIKNIKGFLEGKVEVPIIA